MCHHEARSSRPSMVSTSGWPSIDGITGWAGVDLAELAGEVGLLVGREVLVGEEEHEMGDTARPAPRPPPSRRRAGGPGRGRRPRRRCRARSAGCRARSPPSCVHGAPACQGPQPPVHRGRAAYRVATRRWHVASRHRTHGCEGRALWRSRAPSVGTVVAPVPAPTRGRQVGAWRWSSSSCVRHRGGRRRPRLVGDGPATRPRPPAGRPGPSGVARRPGVSTSSARGHRHDRSTSCSRCRT